MLGLALLVPSQQERLHPLILCTTAWCCEDWQVSEGLGAKNGKCHAEVKDYTVLLSE